MFHIVLLQSSSVSDLWTIQCTHIYFRYFVDFFLPFRSIFTMLRKWPGMIKSRYDCNSKTREPIYNAVFLTCAHKSYWTQTKMVDRKIIEIFEFKFLHWILVVPSQKNANIQWKQCAQIRNFMLNGVWK